MRRSLGLVLALLCWPAPAAAAEPPARPRHTFRHYGEGHGLLNPMVSSLLQDRTGFLWAGTGDGLYRFDGRQFTGFGLADGLPSAIVDALHQDPDGTLWVATSLGLCRRDGERFRVLGKQQGVEESSFLPQGVASSGGELLIANGHGLQSLRGGRFVTVEVPGLGPKVGAIHVAPDGSLWLAGEAGVAVRRDGAWAVFGPEAGLPRDRWQSVVVDPQGEAWLRSPGRLFSLPKGERRFVDRGQDLPPANSFASLLVDSRGELWVPTDFGLAHRTDHGFEVVGKARGLTADAVLAVLEDREGLLWVGLAGAGLDCWLGYPSWTSYTTSEGLNNDAVWSVARDASGAVWVGTDAGLNRLDPDTGRWRSWGATDGLGGDCAYAVRIGHGGEVWVGLYPGGVALLLRDGSFVVHSKADGLPDDLVNDILVDPDGTVWAATASGLARAAPAPGRRRFQPVEVPGGKPEEAFWALLRDRQGRLWAGGRWGLALLEAGRWRRFGRSQGLRDENVACLADDEAGGVWGCYFEPLGALHLRPAGGSFELTHLDRATGLAADSVQALAVDGPRLWIGTSRGVHVLEDGRLQHLGHADGMISDNVNALQVSAQGAWLGTGRGLARYLPTPRLPLPAPRVVLLRASLGGQAAFEGAQVGPGESTLEASFAGLSFRKPEGLRFRYRLLGLDDAPVETALREVRYARLPPGSYTFEVSSRNEDGPWSAPPARLSFRVLPPWYRTWPALLGGLALLALVVVGGHRLRVRRLVAAQRELEEAVALRTAELAREKQRAEIQAQELVEAAEERRRVYAMVVHDLKNPLTPILGGLDFVEQGLRPDFGPGRELLDTMRRATRRMLALIESYTQTLRATSHQGLRGLSALDLVSDLALSYAPSARRRGLALFVNGRPVDDDFAPGRGGALLDVPADRVYRVLENLMSNALKYAKGEIRLFVEERADRVLLAVENDGPAIPLAERERIFGLYLQVQDARPGTGVGLASARNEVEEMRGTIGVTDASAGGPRFELSLPRQLTAPAAEAPRA